MPSGRRSVVERFFSKTKLADVIRPGMTTPCLEWQAGRHVFGYGVNWSTIGRILSRKIWAHVELEGSQ
jgi:hypothetical protein